ncbi:sensor histidine kinase KdpD [Helicobacter sp. MIT 99-5507]|uniref:sensor histidine kinase n=1 Tax=Helicobacter sp. MIT 99-5507 TaxID=152489 RepID=UPI000E1ED15A|nr:HAMP domain-containing sensor histidine kinase [Helicobacter sp. MIT 99-5507]RDU56511.1 hypothetical protein CQA42_06750 [Helicobacter sp. MIT 99-5507]
MIKSRLLTNKITIFFLMLTSIYFLTNITLAIIYINNEKRQDLEILLWHSINESYDYVKKYNDKTNLDFLYHIPHMTSVIEKIGGREILFFFTKERYKPKKGEIAVSKKLPNGTYFNLKSSDIAVKKHIYETAMQLILQHLIYLIIIGILGIYFIRKLLSPLNYLANQCKNYKSGNEFYTNGKNVGDEIKQIESALNMLIHRFEELRIKDKDLFATATHELKTPLAILKARVEKFQHNQEYKKDAFIDDINEDIKRLYIEIQSVLYFNIFDFDEKTDISVIQSIKDIISKVDLLLKNRELEVEIIGDDFILHTRQNLFLKMLMSIFENAIAYAQSKSTIKISLDSKIIKIQNTQGSNINLFSSKLGIKILGKLCSELNFTFDIIKDRKNYEVVIDFN